VSLGSIAYLGSHGSEILHPGSIAPEMDRELQAWTRRVQNFAREAYSESLRKLRVRLEDKEAIAALHWRDVPDEEEAERGVREVAEAAEKAGFNAHWGRKVLEIRPPVEVNKGQAVRELIRRYELRAGLFAGDDVTDLDGFAALDGLGAVRVGVRSDEGPPEIVERADLVVDDMADVLAALA
jgi:trehalose 6-phosphate phosphatase